MSAIARKHVDLSVVLCAHNPRMDYLRRVLEASRQQSLAPDRWEFVLVDNASTAPLKDRLELEWHPHARVVREESLGLTSARLRGIEETSAGVIAFLDADTVPSPDYFETGLCLANEDPTLGAWGGQVRLEFEQDPPAWTRRHWASLAFLSVAGEARTCSRRLDEGPLPNGASLWVRREVAAAYASRVRGNRLLYELDRKGDNLMSGGDTDLVMTACDLGLARALFPQLQIRHLIPPERLEEAYLLKLAEELAYSSRVLTMARTPSIVPKATGMRWWIRVLCAAAFRCGRRRRFFIAYKRGEWRARRFYEDWAHSKGVPT